MFEVVGKGPEEELVENAALLDIGGRKQLPGSPSWLSS
jgi:hypothetical protein